MNFIKELRQLFEGPKGTVLFVALCIIAAYLFLQLIPMLIKLAVIGGIGYLGYTLYLKRK